VPGLGQVSRVGLGTWQFGSREWGYGEGYATSAAAAIVARARELGVTLFDTAEVYGFGRSERILGRALGADADKVIVASKVFPVAPFPAVVRNREQASARRLQIRRIPLYQVHQPNPVVPDSVIMPGMRAMLQDDLIGAVGVSNYSLRRWRKADDALGQPVVSNQVQFSLAHIEPLGAWVGNNIHDHLWRKKLRIRLPGSGCPNFWDFGPSWWSASSDSPVGLALRTHAPSGTFLAIPVLSGNRAGQQGSGGWLGVLPNSASGGVGVEPE